MPGLAFVTGGASGIGMALADRLVKAGYRVAVADQNAEGLRQAATANGWPDAQILLLPLDVRDSAAWTAAMDAAEARLGPLAVMVNVAGVLRPGWVKDVTPADVNFQIDVNTKGLIYGTVEAARRMAPRRAGHIVNIASMAALAPVPGLALYSASKFAVRAFSLATAIEMREHGVAVSVVCPDAVQTPMLDIQHGREEAELTFSGDSYLTAGGVADTIVNTVLPERPLEIYLPLKRGVLARVADMFPAAALALGPKLRERGRRRQRRWQPGTR